MLTSGGRRPERADYLKCLTQWYPGQRLGLGILRTEVQHGHLHVLYQDLTDGPVPEACYCGDEFFGSFRALRSLEVGDGQVRRACGFLQAAACAQSIP